MVAAASCCIPSNPLWGTSANLLRRKPRNWKRHSTNKNTSFFLKAHYYQRSTAAAPRADVEPGRSVDLQFNGTNAPEINTATVSANLRKDSRSRVFKGSWTCVVFYLVYFSLRSTVRVMDRSERKIPCYRSAPSTVSMGAYGKTRNIFEALIFEKIREDPIWYWPPHFLESTCPVSTKFCSIPANSIREKFDQTNEDTFPNLLLSWTRASAPQTMTKATKIENEALISHKSTHRQIFSIAWQVALFQTCALRATSIDFQGKIFSRSWLSAKLHAFTAICSSPTAFYGLKAREKQKCPLVILKRPLCTLISSASAFKFYQNFDPVHLTSQLPIWRKKCRFGAKSWFLQTAESRPKEQDDYIRTQVWGAQAHSVRHVPSTTNVTFH